jgi:hypothetical protein
MKDKDKARNKQEKESGRKNMETQKETRVRANKIRFNVEWETKDNAREMYRKDLLMKTYKDHNTQTYVAGTCEYGNELSGSIKGGEFLD